jgi:mRNA interferase MazF
VKRGEVWWARLEKEQPVVLLCGGDKTELRAMRIVPPATADQKRGFVVLSGEEACDIRERTRIVAAAGAVGGVGVEVEISAPEGLPSAGVVRVALPRDDRIFCTWLLTLTPDRLVRIIGALSSEELRQLDNALHLAAIE